MPKKEILCPHCDASFTPYGAFMLEKCYCPVCSHTFHIIKGAGLIRFLYSVFAFVFLLTIYNIIRPETSVIIAIFWVGAMLFLKTITYITHYFLLITYSLWQKIRKK